MVPVILKPKQKKINEEKKKEKNPKTTEEKNVKKQLKPITPEIP